MLRILEWFTGAESRVNGRRKKTANMVTLGRILLSGGAEKMARAGGRCGVKKEVSVNIWKTE